MKLSPLKIAHTSAFISSLLIGSLAAASSVSVSPTTYLDELASSREYFPEVSRAEVIADLAQADIISVGETHETGFERHFLKAFYDTLSTAVTEAPAECLVENYEMLLSKTDEVRSSFAKICPEENVFNNVGGFNYIKPIADALKLGKVLTHTGYRHPFPIGLMYPSQDFPSPTWVDLPEHGSIVKQLPSRFEKDGSQMRGVGMRAIEELYMSRVATDMQALVGSTVNPAALTQEAAKIRNWAKSVSFQPNQEARFFEIRRINLSFPYAKSYLSLLNHKEFSPELAAKLIESEDFKKLLQTSTQDLHIGCYITDQPLSIFEAGSVSIKESGTIYAYATSLATNRNVVVSISPTHGIQTESSNR